MISFFFLLLTIFFNTENVEKRMAELDEQVIVASAYGIKQFIVVVNKMDLVNFSESEFQARKSAVETIMQKRYCTFNNILSVSTFMRFCKMWRCRGKIFASECSRRRQLNQSPTINAVVARTNTR